MLIVLHVPTNIGPAEIQPTAEPGMIRSLQSIASWAQILFRSRSLSDDTDEGAVDFSLTSPLLVEPFPSAEACFSDLIGFGICRINSSYSDTRIENNKA